MNNLYSLVEMRKTLASMNDRLTPYSSAREYQRYLDNLYHYKKILNSFTRLSNDELDEAIRKCNMICIRQPETAYVR
jgi:hypothetical protein